MPGKVVTRDEWLAARKVLLEKEKEHTRANDALAAERRSLPMVKIDKEYTFKGTSGKTFTLDDLFAGKDQLIVYHFMFDPDWERGCSGCTHVGESLPDVRHLRHKNANLVSISRAPIEKLDAYKKKAGWTFPWYSSEGSDFNYDFDATLDEAHPGLLNFRNKAEVEAKGQEWYAGDVPGYSVFFKKDGEIYHTYSTFARGGESMMASMTLLDLTPLGRDLDKSGPAEFKLREEYGPLE